ncbi:mitochondria protoheme IX farnesyltransferase [Delitschia confertaspora ATCC 74209]|uniref:Protoheme IX farnesyltransferase, mitochondrial n=1 Tax=Delitschia confertaspora ATCC 74209 TaxID=1513339 RepID=A0A9P4JFA8_9PLEO|nr:mitochondria protoheme IX farnesyltransferase [Delitschia confertaspora ATCC 74209]
MHVRPPLPRTGAIRDTNTVCLRCWQRVGGSPIPPRQFFSSAAASRRGAVAVGKSRNPFNKDYFWPNSSFKDSIGRLSRSKRELQSSGASSKDHTVTSSSTAAHHEVSSGTSTKHMLPHRRKKQLQEEVENAAKEFPIPLDASSKLANLSSQLPSRSLKRLLATYLSLSKPRLSFLVVLTATATYSLFPVPGLLAPATTATPSLSTLTLFFLTTGTALCSSSANALNMLMEPVHDGKMSRTRNRPLVRKLISPSGAMVFAIICGAVGTGALYYGVNPTTAFLGAANIVLYAGIYTPMKRMSVLNTWVGAIVGGIPPLMGWTAAAGQCADKGTWDELLFSEGSIGGWLCAALLFAWQFPHFNSLSWSIREEYKHAGYRMLAWVNPAQNGRVALRYAVVMFPICFGLSYVGVTDWGFVATSSAVNGWMAWRAVQFWREKGHKGTARGLFWASVWHLPIVMVLAMAHKKGLWERVWRSIVGYPEDDDLLYDVEEEEEEQEEEEKPRKMAVVKA